MTDTDIVFEIEDLPDLVPITNEDTTILECKKPNKKLNYENDNFNIIVNPKNSITNFDVKDSDIQYIYLLKSKSGGYKIFYNSDIEIFKDHPLCYAYTKVSNYIEKTKIFNILLNIVNIESYYLYIIFQLLYHEFGILFVKDVDYNLDIAKFIKVEINEIILNIYGKISIFCYKNNRNIYIIHYSNEDSFYTNEFYELIYYTGVISYARYKYDSLYIIFEKFLMTEKYNSNFNIFNIDNETIRENIINFILLIK